MEAIAAVIVLAVGIMLERGRRARHPIRIDERDR
jgi:hypothetical protein